MSINELLTGNTYFHLVSETKTFCVIAIELLVKICSRLGELQRVLETLVRPVFSQQGFVL